MRWNGVRRLREAGGCIDRGLREVMQGAAEGRPRVSGLP